MNARLSVREVVRRRLASQYLVGPRAATPLEVVRALGAVQAQDYAGAKWAVAQRTSGMTDAAMEDALNAGTILRTHVLRPTWHFVAPADIRWMLALTAPRVKAAMGSVDRTLELDVRIHRRSQAVLVKALSGGGHLTRADISAELHRAGIAGAAGQRLGHILMRAELDAVICSGPRAGNQSTHALLEERVPAAAPMDRDQALLELTCRYFATHGPATTSDFAWWSGLTVSDAKRGIEIAGSRLTTTMVGDLTMWLTERSISTTGRATHLLPNYDEFFIGHRDRAAIAQRIGHADLITGGNARITHVVVINGQLVGGWRRVVAKGIVGVELNLAVPLTAAETKSIAAAADRLGRYLQMPVELRNPRTIRTAHAT